MKSKNNIKILAFVMLVSLVMTGCTKNNNTIQTTDSTSTAQTVNNNNTDKNVSELEKIILEGNKRYYTEGEIQNKSSYELSLLRNGLFALSGKTFVGNQEVKAFFEGCDWYSPDTEDSNIVKSRFNEYQNANLDLIISIESSRTNLSTQTAETYANDFGITTQENYFNSNSYDYSNEYEVEYPNIDEYEETTTYSVPTTTTTITTAKTTAATTAKPTTPKLTRVINGVKFRYQTTYYDEKGGKITFSKFNITDPGEGYGVYHIDIEASIQKGKRAIFQYNAYDKNGYLLNKFANQPLGTLNGSKVKDHWNVWGRYDREISRIDIVLQHMTY